MRVHVLRVCRQAIYCLTKVIARNKDDLDARWDRAVLYAEVGETYKATLQFAKVSVMPVVRVCGSSCCAECVGHVWRMLIVWDMCGIWGGACACATTPTLPKGWPKQSGS